MTDTMNDLFVTEVFLCMDDIVYDFAEGKMENARAEGSLVMAPGLPFSLSPILLGDW